MTTAKPHPVSLKATYWIGTEHNDAVETRIFDASNTEPAIAGLPPGTDPIKPKPGDFTYSGMHDAGPLPPLREGGEMALLIGCVQRAKEFSDTFLTQVMEREKASGERHSKQQHDSKDHDEEHETKKARKESDEMR